MPQMKMGGFLFGERSVELQGAMDFVDLRHGLRCELRLNPDGRGALRGLLSKAPATPTDAVRGNLVGPTGETLSMVSGSWLDALEFDGTAYWEVDATPFAFPYAAATAQGRRGLAGEPVFLLPSDCRFREDLVLLSAGRLKSAQENKVRLEVLQRIDRRLRTDGAKERGVARPGH
jgi:hypothetical protein